MYQHNIKLIYLKNMAMFLFFGLLIASITTYINYNIEYKKIDNKIDSDSLYISNKIKTFTKNYLEKIDNSMDAIKTSRLFSDYLLKPTTLSKENTTELFINTMKNNNNVFQLRFLDANGMEKIRVDRQKNTHKLLVSTDNELQNKSSRYYFTQTIENKNGHYWYSAIDLNIERGELEKPLRPTYRVATNVYEQGTLRGVLIANIDMSYLLEYIKKNNGFDTYLIDKDGYFIFNPDSKKSWSRYLNTKHTIYTEFESMDEELFKLNQFGKFGLLFSLEEYFKNGEDIKLGLHIKKQYITSIENENLEFAYTLGFIILLISIPIGLLISIPTSKLYLEFNQLYKDNLRYMDTIDKYVITMGVDLNKNIIDVSSALCQRTGYTKDELIGKTPAIFKSGKMQRKVYQNLWNQISSGLVWSGELQNRTKSGEYYWIDATILPNFNQNNIITSFTSISKDITDRKIIEIISQTDKLTQIFNRTKLDDVLENEFSRFLRHKHTFSLIIMDIDHFKSVNDNYGHQVGDSVLIEFAQLLKEHCRKTDILGRWGGEEFMIICLDTDADGAYNLAQNLRQSVENFEFDIVKHKTVSIGVSQVQDTDNIETIIKRVDDYLYRAKEEGRNRVISDADKL